MTPQRYTVPRKSSTKNAFAAAAIRCCRRASCSSAGVVNRSNEASSLEPMFIIYVPNQANITIESRRWSSEEQQRVEILDLPSPYLVLRGFWHL